METYTKTETKVWTAPPFNPFPVLREGAKVMPPNVVKIETTTVTTYRKEEE